MTRASLRLRRADTASTIRPPVGADQYNSTLRGDADTVLPPVHDGETFLLTDPVGYNGVKAIFMPQQIIDGNPYPEYGNPTAYTLVRSPAGYATTNLDGVPVASYDYTGYTPSPLDQYITVYDNGLSSGKFYYYVLFARYSYSGETYWLRVAASECLVPMDFGYQTKLWQKIPEYYRRLDDENKGSADEGPLRKMIRVLGYETDLQRTWILTVGDLWDVGRLNSRLLPQLGEVLGVGAEVAVGDARYRKLLNNLVYLRKIKGTKDGIEGWMSATTGYRSLVYVGKNIYLSNDDTEQRTSLGLWESAVTNVNLTRITSAGEASGPASGEFYARLTNSTGGAAVPILRYGPATFDRTKAIPVTAAHLYRTSIMARHSEASKTLTPLIDWYNAAGTLISTTTDTAINITTSWASYHSNWLTAPANSVYAVPRWSVSSTANAATVNFWKAMFVDQSWYPDGIPAQYQTTPSTTYESARKVWVNLYPQRTNFAINSDFAVNTYGWSATDPASYELLPSAYSTYAVLLASTEADYADLLSGYDSFATQTTLTFDTVNRWLVINTSATVAPWLTQTSSEFFPVLQNAPYSATLEAMSASGAGTKLLLRMKWYTDDLPGAEIPDTSVSSQFYTLSTTTWTACSIGNCVPPANARYGRLIIETSNLTTDHTDRVRKVLIEDAATPGFYFDGTYTDGAPGDFRFTGTDWQSFSAYHMNFDAVLNGLSSSGRAQSIAPTLVPSDRDVGINSILNGLL